MIDLKDLTKDEVVSTMSKVLTSTSKEIELNAREGATLLFFTPHLGSAALTQCYLATRTALNEVLDVDKVVAAMSDPNLASLDVVIYGQVPVTRNRFGCTVSMSIRDYAEAVVSLSRTSKFLKGEPS